MCSTKQLYDDLKAKCYDWDQILSETRSWWTLDPDHPKKFLSTMDLLKMRVGQYHPYWMAPTTEAQKQAVEYMKQKQAIDGRDIAAKEAKRG
jgi:hypothetical protein